MVDKGKKLNQAQYAKLKGVSRQRISTLIKKGMISLDADGLINVRKADKSFAKFSDPSQRKKIKGRAGKKDSSYAESKARKEGYLADLRELELKQKSGELIKVEEVKQSFFELARRTRDAILNIPDRMGSLSFDQKQEMRIELTKTLEELSQ